MELHQFRNTIREWFREQVALDTDLVELPLIVTNEGSDFGVEQVWLRQTLQIGGSSVVGSGDRKLHRRTGRAFVEVFGPKAEGEGVVSEIAGKVESIWRKAMVAANSPDMTIRIWDPHSFERSEPDRYCQVVSVPLEQDFFA